MANISYTPAADTQVSLYDDVLGPVRWSGKPLRFWYALFINFGGVLDSSGTAAGAVVVPSSPALAGISFSIGFVTVSPSAPLGIQHISGPWKVAITK